MSERRGARAARGEAREPPRGRGTGIDDRAAGLGRGSARAAPRWPSRAARERPGVAPALRARLRWRLRPFVPFALPRWALFGLCDCGCGAPRGLRLRPSHLAGSMRDATMADGGVGRAARPMRVRRVARAGWAGARGGRSDSRFISRGTQRARQRARPRAGRGVASPSRSGEWSAPRGRAGRGRAAAGGGNANARDNARLYYFYRPGTRVTLVPARI